VRVVVFIPKRKQQGVHLQFCPHGVHQHWFEYGAIYYVWVHRMSYKSFVTQVNALAYNEALQQNVRFCRSARRA
jgi:hypothetical protein